MEPPTYITLALQKADVEKLAGLTANPARPLLIHLQHADSGLCGQVVDQQSVEREVYVLLGKRNHLESQIAALHRQLKQLSAQYTRLVAQMNTAAQSAAHYTTRILH